MSTWPAARPAVSTAEIEALPLRAPTALQRARARVDGRMTYAVADQVVYSFGNMVVAALLSRHCAQREFGIYILTQRSLDVLIQLCNVLLWAPFTFNLPSLTEDRRKSYQSSIFCLQVLACMLFSGLLWAASHWARFAARDLYLATFAPLVLTSGGILFREFTRRMYFSTLRMREAFWTDVVTVVLQVGGVEWLYLTGRLNVARTLLVLLAGAALVSLWWLYCDAKVSRATLRWLGKDLRWNLRLGRWFFGSNMVFLVTSQCNPWVLGSLTGGAAVGAYAVCESVVNIPRVALTSMQNVMGPALARAKAEGGRPAVVTSVRKLNSILLWGSISFAGVILAAGPFLTHLIFRVTPGNARLILALLSSNLVVYASTLAQAYGLSALDRADLTFYANLAGLALQTAVCIWLVHRFQVPGAALAMLLGSVGVVVVRALAFRRETRPVPC